MSFIRLHDKKNVSSHARGTDVYKKKKKAKSKVKKKDRSVVCDFSNREFRLPAASTVLDKTFFDCLAEEKHTGEHHLVFRFTKEDDYVFVSGDSSEIWKVYNGAFAKLSNNQFYSEKHTLELIEKSKKEAIRGLKAKYFQYGYADVDVASPSNNSVELLDCYRTVSHNSPAGVSSKRLKMSTSKDEEVVDIKSDLGVRILILVGLLVEFFVACYGMYEVSIDQFCILLDVSRNVFGRIYYVNITFSGIESISTDTFSHISTFVAEKLMCGTLHSISCSWPVVPLPVVGSLKERAGNVQTVNTGFNTTITWALPHC